MDVVEFRRLTARVVATRNSESRAFLKAFDVGLGITSRCTAWSGVRLEVRWNGAFGTGRDGRYAATALPSQGIVVVIGWVSVTGKYDPKLAPAKRTADRLPATASPCDQSAPSSSFLSA
jgi:hypothetical protein